MLKMAKRSGQVDDEGRPAPWYERCFNARVCFFALVVGILSIVFIASRQVTGAAGASLSATSSLRQLPVHPPKPYSYSTFMAWLRKSDFSTVDSLKWKPEVDEFDVDAAAKGKKFGPHMIGADASKALAVSKSINKFVFMDDIMLTGDLTTIGGPGTHLYILSKLLAAADGVAKPTFLDAGCGAGYLLMAWVLATGADSRAIGMDLDPAVIASAQRHLADPEALDEASKIPNGAKTDSYVGDALKPDAAALKLELGTVDAINVGLAVESQEELEPLAKFLRVGGKMAAPVCLPPAERKAAPEGRCDSRFMLFQKKADGTLQREDGDPDIPVQFIVALRDKNAPPANLRR